jgi:hypothetical protein
MYLREIVFEDMDCIRLAQGNVQWLALINTIINLRVALKARSFLTSRAIVSSSSRALQSRPALRSTPSCLVFELHAPPAIRSLRTNTPSRVWFLEYSFLDH